MVVFAVVVVVELLSTPSSWMGSWFLTMVCTEFGFDDKVALGRSARAAADASVLNSVVVLILLWELMLLRRLLMLSLVQTPSSIHFLHSVILGIIMCYCNKEPIYNIFSFHIEMGLIYRQEYNHPTIAVLINMQNTTTISVVSIL
jgi:hypothetical protein